LASKEIKTLPILLERHAITPVLLGNYAAYPEKFVKQILPYPHISAHEFDFFRWKTLLSKTGKAVCGHCIEIKRTELISEIEKKKIHPRAHHLVAEFLSNLYPAIEPDYELIDVFERAIKKDDVLGIAQLLSLSEAVRDVRTTQVFNARTMLPAPAMPQLLNSTKLALPSVSTEEIAVINKALANSLDLSVPNGVSINKFLDKVNPYREELSTIVNSLMNESLDNGEVSLSKLSARLGELNEQLLSLATKKRYIAYRASIGFTKANKTLLTSSMLAAIFGITGNLVGCGVSIASGIGIDIVRRARKVKSSPDVTRLGNVITHSLRPHVNSFLAKYLNLDVKAVQLYEIKERLHHESKRGVRTLAHQGKGKQKLIKKRRR
jgi:hypothetical protein